MYVSHWDEAAHETFAVISYLPNVGGSGHLLLLPKVDVAGTQAAAELLLKRQGWDGVLRKAIGADGTLRFLKCCCGRQVSNQMQPGHSGLRTELREEFAL